MIFVPSVAQDISKYYKNSFVKFEEFGDEFFQITGISSKAVKFKRANGDEGEIALHEDAPYDLKFTLPHKSYFQKGQNAYLLARLPARQYSRGITGENCIIYGLTANGEFVNSGLNFTMLQAFANKPHFLSITDSVRMKSMKSCCLSPRFAVCSVGGVYVDTVHIGSYQIDQKRTIFKVRPAFHLELRRIAESYGEQDLIILQQG